MRLLDVAPQHVRFGFSVARECLRGIEVLLHPAKHAEQMPWVRDARRRLPRDVRAAMERFRFFFEPTTEVFPYLWNETRKPSFDADVMALRSDLGAYRDAVVRRLSGKRLFEAAELAAMRRPRWYRAAAAEYSQRHPHSREMLDAFVRSPAESLRAFCAMLADFHARVFAPAWDAIDARLLADIAMRCKVLHDFGAAALLRTLGTKFDGDAEIRFDARSRLLLTPSFFTWPRHELLVLRTPRGLRCTIAYPIPPLTAKTAKLADDDDLARACAALGDPLRLRVLALLKERELSTRELAGYLKISEPVTSRHLRALLEAGLVKQRRSGYFVMYALHREALTRLTDALSSF
ncbi:MAG: metalloregulator ArsR/SmtB family transcription factor [Candidatus Aquilonibacter sp.]|jgi:ArsR family transcriptional regulator